MKVRDRDREILTKSDRAREIEKEKLKKVPKERQNKIEK